MRLCGAVPHYRVPELNCYHLRAKCPTLGDLHLPLEAPLPRGTALILQSTSIDVVLGPALVVEHGTQRPFQLLTASGVSRQGIVRSEPIQLRLTGERGVDGINLVARRGAERTGLAGVLSAPPVASGSKRISPTSKSALLSSRLLPGRQRDGWTWFRVMCQLCEGETAGLTKGNSVSVQWVLTALEASLHSSMRWVPSALPDGPTELAEDYNSSMRPISSRPVSALSTSASPISAHPLSARLDSPRSGSSRPLSAHPISARSLPQRSLCVRPLSRRSAHSRSVSSELT